MEDHNKMDQQSDRPNRDQETDKKPTQGTPDIHRPQKDNLEQGQPGNIQKDKEKKSA
jgi:hypothetical protein